MKKTALFVLVIIFVLSLNAQEEFPKNPTFDYFYKEKKDNRNEDVVKDTKDGLVFIGKTIFHNSILKKEREALSYDPASDMINLMEFPDPNSYPAPSIYSLILHQSTDGGENWSYKLPLNDTAIIGFPQAYIFNPDYVESPDSVIIGSIGYESFENIYFYSAMNGGCNNGFDFKSIPKNCTSESVYYGNEVTDDGYVYALSLCYETQSKDYTKFDLNIYRGEGANDHIDFGENYISVIDVLNQVAGFRFEYSIAWSQDGSIGYVFGIGVLNEYIGETSFSPIVWKSIDSGQSWQLLVEGMNMVDFDGLENVLLESEDGHYIPLFSGELTGIVDSNGDLQFFGECNSAKSLTEPYTTMVDDGRARVMNVTVSATEGITGFNYVSTYLSDNVEDSYADMFGWTHRLQSSRSADGLNYFVIYGDTEDADVLYQGQNANPDLYLWGKSLDEEFSSYSPYITKVTDGAHAFYHYSSDISKSLGGPLFEIPTTTTVSMIEMFMNQIEDPVTISYVDKVIFDLSDGEMLLPPVELSAVQTVGVEDDVKLKWKSVGNDVLGFEIYRNGELLETMMNPDTLSYIDMNTGYGIFTYCVKAVYSEGVSNCSKEANIQVVYSPELCIDGLYTNGCTMGDGIIIWDFADVNNLSIKCDGVSYPWYHDCQNLVHTLEPDNDYLLTVQGGYANTYLKVWIDYNDNYQLEENEVIVDNYLLEEDSVDYEILVNIPADANSGIHTLRYRTNWNEVVGGPCDVIQYGNMADFTAYIPSETALSPPPNLSASLNGDTIVQLTWDKPFESAISHSSEFDPENSFGLSEGGTYYAALKFEFDNSYRGAMLDSISFIPMGDGSASFVLKVWEGENGSLVEVYSYEIMNYVPSEWNTFAFYYNYPIYHNKTLWIGYEVTHEEMNMPSGVDIGPAVEGGNMFSVDGQNFTTLTDEFGLDINLSISAKLGFLGSYNVSYKHDSFVDFVSLANVMDETYNHLIEDGNGTYYYQVSTVLFGEESEPSTAQVQANAINENSVQAVSIFPNPADNFVYVSAGKKIVTINVYNILGKMIRKFEPDKISTQIDVSKLKGIYFFQILTEDGAINKKVIIH